MTVDGKLFYRVMFPEVFCSSRRNLRLMINMMRASAERVNMVPAIGTTDLPGMRLKRIPARDPRPKRRLPITEEAVPVISGNFPRV